MTSNRNGRTLKRVIKMMVAHSQSLEAAGADRDVVNAYAAIIEFVDIQGHEILDSEENTRDKSKSADPLIKSAQSLSLEDVEKLATAEDISRKSLEILAIHRFGVPNGSLRKWGTKEGLREKVLMMVRNQRVHQTIGEVGKSTGPGGTTSDK